MIKKFLFWLVFIALPLTGCKQYDDGPLLSLYSIEKRIEGSWIFDQVIYGGNDSTEHYLFQQLSFVNMKNTDGGVVVWYHNLYATTWTPNLTQGGIWTFLSDRDSIRLAIVDVTTGDTTATRWKINRLAFTDFWIERTIKDTLKLEWLLWKRTF
jgi:hypothetical protein